MSKEWLARLQERIYSPEIVPQLRGQLTDLQQLHQESYPYLQLSLGGLIFDHQTPLSHLPPTHAYPLFFIAQDPCRLVTSLPGDPPLLVNTQTSPSSLEIFWDTTSSPSNHLQKHPQSGTYPYPKRYPHTQPVRKLLLTRQAYFAPEMADHSLLITRLGLNQPHRASFVYHSLRRYFPPKNQTIEAPSPHALRPTLDLTYGQLV